MQSQRRDRIVFGATAALLAGAIAFIAVAIPTAPTGPLLTAPEAAAEVAAPGAPADPPPATLVSAPGARAASAPIPGPSPTTGLEHELAFLLARPASPSLVAELAAAPVTEPEAPVAADDVPVAADDVPVAADDVPVAADDVPVAADDVPVAADDVPVAADDDAEDAVVDTAPAPDPTPESEVETTAPGPGDDTVEVDHHVSTIPDPPDVGASDTPRTFEVDRPEAPDDPWAGVRRCESHNNYSINTGNGFYGAYQFTISTWNWVAGLIDRTDLVGLRPDLAAPADQDRMAQALAFEVAGGGLGHWPVCGRHYG